MKFSEFLETTNDIKFGSFWKDGTVAVHINGKRYVYTTDAVYHPAWQRMARYKPGTVLSQIKDMVKRGLAQQIDPVPEPVPQQSVQGTFF